MTASKVSEIKPKPNASCVEVLEDALEMAKRGEIRGCAVSWITERNGIAGDWSGGNNQLTLWAAMCHIEREFHSRVILENPEVE